MKRAWIFVFLLMFAVPAFADSSAPGAPDRELIISSYQDGMTIVPVMGKKEGSGDKGTTSGSGSATMPKEQSRPGETGSATMPKDQSRSGSEMGKGETGAKGDTGTAGKPQQGGSATSPGMGSSSGSSSGMGPKSPGSSTSR